MIRLCEASTLLFIPEIMATERTELLQIRAPTSKMFNISPEREKKIPAILGHGAKNSKPRFVLDSKHFLWKLSLCVSLILRHSQYR